VPAPELMAKAHALAELVASKAPLGLRMGKAALNETEFLPVEGGYAVEQRYSTKLMATEDAREATRAGVEKRRPVFHGRWPAPRLKLRDGEGVGQQRCLNRVRLDGSG